MIDRATLWICVTVFFAVTAATLWRLSAIPDWQQVPLDDVGGHTVSWLRLFILPGCLLLVTLRSLGRGWFATGPEENIELWRRWSTALLLPFCAITVLVQGLILLRPLGIGADLDPAAVTNGIMVVTGILLIVLGNFRPKLPWLLMRFSLFQLEPWQWKRHLRANGRQMVGLGLFLAVGAPLLPSEWFRAIVFTLILAMLTAGVAYRIKLRREPPPC